MAVAGALVLLTAASAAAVPRPDDDVAPVAPGGQHGANDGHLPPVRKNIELVSKLELTGKFGDVVSDQIADVSVYKGFAYLNSWDTPSCDRGGTYVVDIRDPSKPKEVGFLGALPQNYHGEGAHVISVDTPAFKGDVLAVNNEWCSGTDPERGGGMDLWNVTDPSKPELLAQGVGDFSPTLPARPNRAHSSHSVFLWTTGAKAYAVQVDNEEGADVDIFDITNPRSPQPVAEYDLVDDTFGPKTWTETPLGDTPFHHDVVVKQRGGRWVMLASYWDAGYVELDVTDPANATYIADTDFTTLDPLTGFAPPEGNAHQAEYTAGDQYIVTGEEDFAPYRVVSADLVGEEGTVDTVDASAVGGGAPPEALPDRVLNGPMAYGGYGCPPSDTSPGSPPVPQADDVFDPADLEEGEEQILILQRGPTQDTNDTYEACFPGEKADVAYEAGWDAVVLVNRHLGSQDDDSAFCGTGAFTRSIVAVCLPHEALHRLFDDPTIDASDFALPYDDEADVELPPPGGGFMQIGSESPYKISVQGVFDGWGYMSLYSATPDASGKLPLLDTYAIPEALNPAYAIGYGDLSIHEQAADPTEPLSYSSYYSGGMRVFSVAGGAIAETGAYIDDGGNDFWGVEQFTTPDGERLFAGSDRDYGLYLFRYTGPGAAKRPACSDATVAVPYKGSATVPLACSDANGNALTRSVASQPGQGTLAAVDNAAGTVSYKHTGRSLGADQFTFTANDGAATSAPATARIAVVGAKGGRCFNRVLGTAASERLVGSRYGDTLRGGRGNDRARALGGRDCVLGQSGRDRLNGDSGADRVHGGSGRDRLNGGSSRDRLRGGKGNDRLSGGTSSDRLRGEGGNDRIVAGPGKNHRVFGGNGNDRIDTVNGKRDRIRCGNGEDSVSADRKDRVARKSCEEIDRS